MTTRTAVALMVATAGVAAGHAVSDAEPDAASGHQVTYTVTAQDSLMANVSYIHADPPSLAGYNADASKYLTTLHVPISPEAPLVYTVTLTDPEQWALVTASGGLRVNPYFHCELAIDGRVVVQQDAGSGVTCGMRAW